MERASIKQEQELQRVKAYCTPWADQMGANFGHSELGTPLAVMDNVNLWFGRAGLEEFIEAVAAGRGDSAPLPRLLQLHIWPIANFEQWPQLAQLVGDKLTAKLQAMHAEAMAKPAVRLYPSDEGFSKAMKDNSCESEFEAASLTRLQVIDALLAADRLVKGDSSE